MTNASHSIGKPVLKVSVIKTDIPSCVCGLWMGSTEHGLAVNFLSGILGRQVGRDINKIYATLIKLLTDVQCTCKGRV